MYLPPPPSPPAPAPPPLTRLPSFLGASFHHIVLPPQIPGQRDSDVAGVEHELLDRLLKAHGTLTELASLEALGPWTATQELLLQCQSLHQRRFDQTAVRIALSDLPHDHPVVFYLAEANSALVIRVAPE